MTIRLKTPACPRLALLVVCLCVLAAPSIGVGQDSSGKDKLIVETLIRLKRYDVSTNKQWKDALDRHLLIVKGTPRYLELVKIFRNQDAIPDLVELAVSTPTETIGVNAASLLLDFKQTVLLQKEIYGQNNTRALAIAQSVALGAHPERYGLLKPLVGDAKMSRQIRNVAIKGVGATKMGQQYLLDLLAKGGIPEELMFVTGTALFASSDPVILKSAEKMISPPTTANAIPIPPISELIRATGDAVAGKVVFANKGNCIKCHKIGDVGKEIGPSLSEIGSKLSKEAMFVSILDPSAGISHNYETYAIVLESGNVLSGIMVSRSDDEVVVRNADGIDRVIAVAEIEEIKKTGVSLMPADLQKVMTIEELVSVVAYLTQLKKSAKGN